MANETLLYQLGQAVGQVFKATYGTQQIRTVTYDDSNGTETSDGISSPTSNFINALSSVQMSLTSKLELNAVNPIAYQAYISFENLTTTIEADSKVKIQFEVLDSNSMTLSSLSLKNSYVEFKNIEFIIPSDVNPQTKLNTSYFLTTMYSTVIFNDCTFTYLGSTLNYVYILSIGSNIIFNNCSFNDTQSTGVISPNVPSLVFAIDSTIPESVHLQDNDISFWIQYSTPSGGKQ